MALLQGNTYGLPIKIKTCCGGVVTADDVNRVQFIIGDLEKFYGDNDTDGVTYDASRECFVVPLTERETFAMSGTVQWQVRVQYKSGNIDGSIVKREDVKSSITTTELTEEVEPEPESEPETNETEE